MSPPNLPRRSVLIGGVSFSSVAFTGAAQAAGNTLALDRAITAAIGACLAADTAACRVAEGTAEQIAAEQRCEATDAVLKQLSDELFAKPITSLADCLSYARLIEMHVDIPHREDIDSTRDRGERALGMLVLKLLDYGGAGRSLEPLTWAEQDRRWEQREAAHDPSDDPFYDPDEAAAVSRFIGDMGGAKSVGDFCGMSAAHIETWPEKGYIPPAWHMRFWVESIKRGIACDPTQLFDMSAADSALLIGDRANG